MRMKGYRRLISAIMASITLATVLLPAWSASAALNADEVDKWNNNLGTLHAYQSDLTYTDGGLRVAPIGGDAFAYSSSVQVTTAFKVETDVTFENNNVAAIVIGGKATNDLTESLIFKFHRSVRSETKVFNYNSSTQGWNDAAPTTNGNYTTDKSSYRLKLEVLGRTVKGYVDGVLACEGTLPSHYVGGYIGVGGLEYTTLVYQNTTFTSLLDGELFGLGSTTEKPVAASFSNGTVSIAPNGSNDALMLSHVKTDRSFVVETQVTFNEGNVANLVFGAPGTDTLTDAMIFKMDRTNRSETKVFCFNGDRGWATVVANNGAAYALDKTTYKLKVVVLDNVCTIYVDDMIVGSGELPSYYNVGYLGIGGANQSTVTFGATDITMLGNYSPADITNISVEGMALTQPFADGVKLGVRTYGVMPVSNETTSVRISATKSAGDGELRINGQAAASGEYVTVPLSVGRNIIPVEIVEPNTGIGTPMTVIVTRKPIDSEYMTEDYRNQYHFSAMQGWINDPNGMIYFNDQWHLFYQAVPLKGTVGDDHDKHWGHAVSDDLIHWEELPMALAPDANGSMWSGSCVDDPRNVSGLFAGPSSNNLIAYYTNCAKDYTQTQCMAYSSDGGVTWTKYSGNPILTGANDPLNDGGFRDPTVFWCEEMSTYLMIIAGGPLRIYSSNDLIHWNYESGNTGINAECPDLFKLPIDGNPNNVKWVFTGAGKWYILGDLKRVGGKITFVPDDGTRHDLTMGIDSYAAVSFKNAPNNRVVTIGWMANWQSLVEIGDIWYGNMTLLYDMSLKSTANGLRIYQTPVPEYASLRQEPQAELEDVVITADNKLLDSCFSDQFELVAHLKPSANVTEIGFKVLEDSQHEMLITYDPRTSKLKLDRTNASAVYVNSNGYYNHLTTEHVISKNADGSVDIRIFVDRGCVEVVASNGQIYGAMLVLPSFTSCGVSVYSKGGNTTADIAVYPLDTIWRETESTNINGVYLDIAANGDGVIKENENVTIHSRVDSPYASQKVTWSLDDPDEIVTIVSHTDNTITIKATDSGRFTLTATAADGVHKVSVPIATQSEMSNIGGWQVSGDGSWAVTENGIYGKTGVDGFYMSDIYLSGDFRLDFDLRMLSGNAFGVVFNAQSQNAPGRASYVVNLDLSDSVYGNQFRWFEFPWGSAGDVAVNRFSDSFKPAYNVTYPVTLSVIDGKMTFIVDGQVIFENAVDGDGTYRYTNGYIGFMGCLSDFIVNNVRLQTSVALEGITLSSGTLTPSFNAATNSYTATVKVDVDSITLTPTASLGATITVNGVAVKSDEASKPIALNVGDNTITVKVAAFDGEKTYTVKITRAHQKGDASGDNKVTITDLLAIKSHLLNKKLLNDKECLRADTNGDGAVTITDFLRVKSFLLGKTTLD